MTTLAFKQAARIPRDGDNVAIATRRLEAGTVIDTGDSKITLSHSVLEGHRFALNAIKSGEALLSWQMPFGKATRDIKAGEYVCNAKILIALAERKVDFKLPDAHNFADHMEICEIDEATFKAGEQVAAATTQATFKGFARSAERGVGTRNFVAVLAVTSDASGFARQVAAQFEGKLDGYPNIDGVVAVTHTEGGGDTQNNIDFVMRTLAGFMVHPNIGAIVAVDYGQGSFTGETLREFMVDGGYPLKQMPYSFFRIEADHETELRRANELITGLLPSVNATPRTDQSAGSVKVALQCGGSDAFSGISGNALAGWVAKEFIRHGGAANIAETDELIGAEPYMLSNVRDIGTARRFLEKIAIFKKRAANHGASAEGNPSGGNNYRGLYNIALKSIGAARKKDPDVRLDYVIDYGAPMENPGYYFMDSPGNDLESIAGQVAAGCNMIFFITGNGSITNFPFVPTLKFVTTTGRFEMLDKEMDVNAGRYNDGESMESLGQETFELALDIASGTMSKGELAGHAQVQLWRNWQQTDDSRLERLAREKPPAGKPLATVSAPALAMNLTAFSNNNGPSIDQIGLIMPTSLCSGQVARLIAEKLNADKTLKTGVNRYVALVHTEGCGSVNAEGLYLSTLAGHLKHGFVQHAVLLEHGCEKTHNDAVANYLASAGHETTNLSWASVQLDGGLEKVTAKVTAQFKQALSAPSSGRSRAEAGMLKVGLSGSGPIDDNAARASARFAAALISAGGTVVVPSNASLLTSRAFTENLLSTPSAVDPTLGYGVAAQSPGLHIMDAPTANVSETITGLGATGAEVMLFHVGKMPVQAHPMIPLLQYSSDTDVLRRFAPDLDLQLVSERQEHSFDQAICDAVQSVADGSYSPKLYSRGNIEFQLTRGRLGISL